MATGRRGGKIMFLLVHQEPIPNPLANEMTAAASAPMIIPAICPRDKPDLSTCHISLSN